MEDLLSAASDGEVLSLWISPPPSSACLFPPPPSHPQIPSNPSDPGGRGIKPAHGVQHAAEGSRQGQLHWNSSWGENKLLSSKSLRPFWSSIIMTPNN